MSRINKRDAAALQALAKLLHQSGPITVGDIAQRACNALGARFLPAITKLADATDYHGSLDNQPAVNDMLVHAAKWAENAHVVLRRSRDETEKARLVQAHHDDLNRSFRDAQRAIDDFRHKVRALEDRVLKVETTDVKESRRKQ